MTISRGDAALNPDDAWAPSRVDEIIARPYALVRRSGGITTKLVPKINIGRTLQVDLLEPTVKMNGGGASISPRCSRRSCMSSPRTPETS
jgi:hypothetical protein